MRVRAVGAVVCVPSGVDQCGNWGLTGEAGGDLGTSNALPRLYDRNSPSGTQSQSDFPFWSWGNTQASLILTYIQRCALRETAFKPCPAEFSVDKTQKGILFSSEYGPALCRVLVIHPATPSRLAGALSLTTSHVKVQTVEGRGREEACSTAPS